MADISEFPEFQAFIDDTATSATVSPRGDGTYLITTYGEEGGQILLRKDESVVHLISADNALRFNHAYRATAVSACLGACDDIQHADVARAIVNKVDRFSSVAGPDNGNLACLWSVRHIIHEALGFWITQSDGTATFYPSLQVCFGQSKLEQDVLPGGIVISPTSGSRVGHIGLLGEGKGDSRLIYSNSSRLANWRQNYNIGTWRARYQGLKGLPVYFFPLPRFHA